MFFKPCAVSFLSDGTSRQGIFPLLIHSRIFFLACSLVEFLLMRQILQRCLYSAYAEEFLNSKGDVFNEKDNGYRSCCIPSSFLSRGNCGALFFSNITRRNTRTNVRYPSVYPIDHGWANQLWFSLPQAVGTTHRPQKGPATRSLFSCKKYYQPSLIFLILFVYQSFAYQNILFHPYP